MVVVGEGLVEPQSLDGWVSRERGGYNTLSHKRFFFSLEVLGLFPPLQSLPLFRPSAQEPRSDQKPTKVNSKAKGTEVSLLYVILVFSFFLPPWMSVLWCYAPIISVVPHDMYMYVPALE